MVRSLTELKRAALKIRHRAAIEALPDTLPREQWNLPAEVVASPKPTAANRPGEATAKRS
jgi:hypothetical protein